MQKEFKLRENDEFIKLGQLLKATGLCDSGVEAKAEIINGNVKVNGQTELQRGKKIKENDIVSFGNENIKVIK